MDPLDVAPGQEGTVCVVAQLGNTEPVYVRQVQTTLHEAAHHFSVVAIPSFGELTGPIDCASLPPPDDGWVPVPLAFTVKDQREGVRLPEGAAFELQPGAAIRMEMHFLNATDQPVAVGASATLAVAESTQVSHIAGVWFEGELPPVLMPGETVTLPPVVHHAPPELAGARFFALTGHTHKWGTAVNIDATSADGEVETPAYHPAEWYWDEPEVAYPDPAIEMPENGGLAVSCSFLNQSPEPVIAGTAADQEMCYFLAYFARPRTF
jgi:hypothetical protein